MCEFEHVELIIDHTKHHVETYCYSNNVAVFQEGDLEFFNAFFFSSALVQHVFDIQGIYFSEYSLPCMTENCNAYVHF